MSTFAATLSAGATKLQIGVAASAIAIAATIPGVVANADTAAPAPLAPVVQMLSEPSLGPISFPEQNIIIDGARVLIEGFGALVVFAAGVFFLPVIAFYEIVTSFLNRPQPGPYGTVG
jgi:hypothetical protein